MKVEIWSDFACPFCFIGKQRFEEALSQFAHKDEVEVAFRSFELDPNAPKEVDQDVHSMLAGKYGMSREQAVAMNENVTRQAKEAGLEFHLDTLILTNTFDAHRLAQYAKKFGKDQQIVKELFQAYFTDSKHLGDPQVLADLAGKAGLDREETLRILAGDDYSAEVREEEEDAGRLGINAVPFFVIDRKYGVSGAQPSPLFLEALQKAWSESQPLQVLNETISSEGCGDGSCTPGNKP
ncbi:DsbA family oxidoreductase [Paenibacillus aurantius]|uniref:DsbA family oxidoreductase n=1 Tax=Paenibacillus aurantius TaxID=2918900 RepID=A0AA96L9A5_9BACL|nr:DsbA family oxidoreductase [Paenibacillus aurantius]WNQ08854.1 DsbA family oxidoreductase [Paenibacillus aurantius]